MDSEEGPLPAEAQECPWFSVSHVVEIAVSGGRTFQVPLSATIDETTGEVTWFQDTTGQTLLNPPKKFSYLRVPL